MENKAKLVPISIEGYVGYSGLNKEERHCTHCGKPESERFSFHGCTGPCNFEYKEVKKCICKHPLRTLTKNKTTYCDDCGGEAIYYQMGQSPHQEPVSTQKKEKCCPNCGFSSEIDIVNNICWSSKCKGKKMTTQEPMECKCGNKLDKNGKCTATIIDLDEEKWSKDFDKEFDTHLNDCEVYRCIRLKEFIQSQIKQAEERERNRIIKGIDELHENYCGTRDDTSVLYKGQGYCEAYYEAEEDIKSIITNQ